MTSKTKKGKGKGKGKSHGVPTHPNDPLGYLIDSRGELYSLADTYVRGLIDGEVKPAKTTTKGRPVWQIDSDGERFYTTAYHINDCVFRATQKYMEAVGLGTLTAGDADFFEDHPRVGPEGVGRANVLGVIQGLVIPWGLGIDHVWMPRWTSLGDQHKKFVAALGINPAAAADAETSNKEFIQGANLDPDSEVARAINSCGFEFVDAPPAPCIVLLSNYGSTAKASPKKTGGANVTGAWGVGFSGLGHADFIGPRDSILGDWEIALSLARSPVYAGDSITGYEDLAYFGKENDIKAQSRLTLSRTQSLVEGKAVSSYGKKTTAITRYAPSAYAPSAKVAEKKCPLCNGRLLGQVGSKYCHQCTWVEDGKEINTASSLEIDALVTSLTKKCPWCAGALGDASGTAFCYQCNWFESSVSSAQDTVCPFCDGAILKGVCNRGCGYNNTAWTESKKWKCATHGTSVFYVHTDAQKNKGIFLCPACVRESGKNVRDLHASKTSHQLRKEN